MTSMAGKAFTPQEINALFTVDEEWSETPVTEDEARFLYDFIREHKLQRTLEIGLGLGRSAAHIMAATGQEHLIVEPHEGFFIPQGEKNLSDMGFDGQFTLIRQASQFQLPLLCAEGKRFDFIFIDGDHRFDGVFVDFYFAEYLLEKNGYIFLHDTWMPSISALVDFIKKNKANFKPIPTQANNLSAWQLTDQGDFRPWHHFRSFRPSPYNWQGRLRAWLLQNQSHRWVGALNRWRKPTGKKEK